MKDSLATETRVPIETATSKSWEAIVLGAGVAGASFAIHAARQGHRTLLVDAQSFPRDKVCGGCLNPRAQRELELLGVLPEVMNAGAIPISSLRIHVAGHVSRWTVPRMLSVRRSTLDLLLVEHAIRNGVVFLPETRGAIQTRNNAADSSVPVRLTPQARDSQPATTLQCRHAVVAAGLSRSPLPRNDVWDLEVEKDSRVGAHCLVDRERLSSFGSLSCSENTLHMLVGDAGYVGICPTDGQAIDIAAALSPSEIRLRGGIGPCVQSVLQGCGVDCQDELHDCEWLATPLLSRKSSRVADRGVFLLGDSAGYVEPFTGEGMSWALEGARVLATLLCGNDAVEREGHLDAEWRHWIETHRRSHQTISKWVAGRARHTRSAKVLLKVLDWTPWVRNYLVQKAMQ